MRIGQDVNMATNIAEGYMIMEYKKRELMTKEGLNPDVCVRFIKHVPDYLKVPFDKLLLDVQLNANDIWKVYQRHQEGIDSFTGQEPREFPVNEYQLVNLADDCDAYCGLS